MKKLIFIRHGRAEDPSTEISDFERSLTLKGKIISRKMALRYREKENNPGIIITSPAFRALETALIFAGILGINPDKIHIYGTLYYKMNFKTLSGILSQIPDDIESITLFGHNPSFTEITNSLSREGNGFIPKCGVVCISFNISAWPDLSPDTGKTEYFMKPEKQI